MGIEKALYKHVNTLAGEIGERNVFNPEALSQSARYIDEEWRAQGYEVSRQTYEAGGIDCSNMEVSIPGGDKPEEIVLIGAHYDSVQGSPGANDNASGVASLLELSRLLAGKEPAKTVRFVAFVNEEPPFFHSRKRGSLVYAKRARSSGDKIMGAIVLETVGCYLDDPGSQRYPAFLKYFYPEKGNFITFVSNLRSYGWLRKVTGAFGSCCDFPAERLAAFTPLAPGAAWSDHSSFWKYGYKALMVTDTAFYRYPYYHTPEDRPDKINYGGLARVTEGLAGTIAVLAE